MKQRNASSGVHMIGSPRTLKLVLTRIGQAVSALNPLRNLLEPPTLTAEARNVRDIIHRVWMSLFERYYLLNERDQQNKS